MHSTRFLPATRAASLALAFAVACSVPTEEITTGPLAAKAGGPQAGGPTPTVDATNPSEAPQDTTLDVEVLGSNYDIGSRANFLLDGKSTPKVKTNRTTFVSSSKLIANITIAVDAVVAAYDVQVTTSGGKKGIGIEMFMVLQRTPPGQWDPPILTVTMRQGGSGSDALRSDDASNLSYPSAAHISLNGNLMFWLGASNVRSVLYTTTAASGGTRDRIFTNNHTNPGGDDSFGLLGMTNGSTGNAVVEIELNLSDNDPYDVLRYGKDCSGTGGGGGSIVPAAKAIVTRSDDGTTWTITGNTGVHCKKLGKKPGLTQIGTAGPFGMTLVQEP